MKKRHLLSIAAYVMVIALLCAYLPVFAVSDSRAFGDLSSLASKYQLMQDIRDSKLQYLGDAPYGKDDEVVFLVELTQKPLLEANGSGARLSDYLGTAAGKTALRRIETEQANALSVVRSSYSDSMEVLYRYDTVFNGFSVRAKYGDLAKLRALPGVRAVTVAQTYDYVEPIDGYGDGVTTSGEMLNSDVANEAGYTGKGTVTAILDTGLDTDHADFQKAPADARLTEEDVEAFLNGDHNAAAETADLLYKSGKVPFAYDYADKDTDVSGGESHGTHVAGTVGADGETFKGVAPDTQLVIMKVFGDNGGGATSDVILAALEDAVALGVDTINMSLGSPGGFTTSDAVTEQAYENVKNAGINLMCAAGNDSNATTGNLLGTDLAKLENPDSGIVGSPSTYPAAVSVASVNEMVERSLYFMGGDRKIKYTDTGTSSELLWTSLNGKTYDFVVVPGYGDAFSFAAVEDTVRGNIALVQRGGEIAFTEKEKNASDAGAVGMIVYDNQEEDLINMQLEGLLPAVFISLSDGEYLKTLKEKKVTMSGAYVDVVESADGGRMSYFSSLGVSPDLTLKPEITAPGGNVWSTMPGNSYASMSGTSMACPHMAGAASVVRQYVETKFGEKLNDVQTRDMVNNLLLSTTTQVVDEHGVAYSPRKQGAGLANVWNAIQAEAYLSVTGSDRPKAELKDNEKGTYSFQFKVHNFGENAKTYEISVLALTAAIEQVEVGEETYDCISELSRVLSEEEFEVKLSKTSVTVQGGGEETVDVTLTLTEKGREALEPFVNGTFLDGFVQLKATDGGVDLSLPYLAFYGDWAKAPVFDSTAYDDEPAYMYDTELYTLGEIDGSYYGYPMGLNALVEDDTYEANKVFYGSSFLALNYSVVPVTGLLRAPKSLSYDVSGDIDAHLVTADNVVKTFYYTTGGYIAYDMLPPYFGFGGLTTDENGEEWDYTKDHRFSFDLTATVDGTDGKTQTLSIPFGYDVTPPQILSTDFYTKEVENEEGEMEPTTFLKLVVMDDNFVQGVQLMSSQKVNVGGTWNYLAYSDVYADESITEAGRAYTFDIPLDDAQRTSLFTGDTAFLVDVIDYGWNETVSKPLPVSGKNDVTSVRINNRNITASAGAPPMVIGAIAYPATAADRSVTFTTDTPQIITQIEELGYNESLDLYEARITFNGQAGTGHVTATASNGVSDTIDILVSAAPYTPELGNWDGKIHYSGTWIIPEGFTNTVQVLCDSDNEGIEPAVTLVSENANATYTCPITVAEGVSLSIRNLHLTAAANPAISVTGKGNTISIEGENQIDVTDKAAGIYVPYDAELTVTGGFRDTLHFNMVSTNEYKPVSGAGIGGNAPASVWGASANDKTVGEITIAGGNLSFTSKSAGACIGGGQYGVAKKITISGGVIDMDIQPVGSGYSLRSSGAAAGIGSGSAVTSANPMKDVVQEIVIDGGTIHGKTTSYGALIGTGFEQSTSQMYQTKIMINSGLIELTGNATDSNLQGYSGALIGTGVDGQGTEIVINGGNITATQNANWDGHGCYAAAIGTGMTKNGNGGSVTINGGTVTAVVTNAPGKDVSAIGAGYYSGYNGSGVTVSVTINGGSVKARTEGADTPSVSGSPIQNTDGKTVYETKLTAGYDTYWPTSITVDGEPYSFDGTHPGDEYSLYPWLTVGTHTVDVAVSGKNPTHYKAVVGEDGSVELTRMFAVGAFLDFLTPDNMDFKYRMDGENETTDFYLGEMIEEGGTLEVTLTPREGYVLPESVGERSLYITVDGYISTTDFTYDPQTGKVTVDGISGDTYVVALAQVDKTELWDLLVYAAGLDPNDYEDNEAWDTFLFEFAYAKGIYNDPTADGGTVNGAYNVLLEAINRLTKRHDTEALEAAIAQAQGLNQEYYTADSWNAVEEALADAERVLAKEDASQTEIDSATAWLTEALGKLVPDTDKTALDALVKEAEALNGEDYTEETWAALTEALEAAKGVLADAAVLQPAVDAAQTALQEALDALRERLPDTDKTALDALVKKAEALNAEDYTEETWAALTEALEAAKGVLADDAALQSAVDAAQTALQTALDALEEAKRSLLGDVNEDGTIDALDYTMVKRAVLHTFKLTDKKALLADVNGDHAVNSLDYMCIKRHVLKTFVITQPE